MQLPSVPFRKFTSASGECAHCTLLLHRIRGSSFESCMMLDDGEVETVAHYYAAAFFDPKVDCILDIGGQDMKCIKIKNQTVDSVQLNEDVLPAAVLSLKLLQNP